MLTKEQFRAQFTRRVVFKDFEPIYSETFHGYKIFRALQLIVLQEADGSFWVAANAL